MKVVNIYPDRTPKQRKEYKELIAEARRRREAGENVAVVNGVLKHFPAKQASGRGAPSRPVGPQSDTGGR